MNQPDLVYWGFQGLFAVLCAVLGWNFKTLKAELVQEAASREKSDQEASIAREKLDRDLQSYKLHVAETYVTQSDLTKAIDTFSKSVEAVFKKLERIEDKLDNKADKP